MKILNKYEDFVDYRQIKEDVGDNTDPFVNVKGNFAGAENTLIGSAIINIFTFMKRKINEGVLVLYKNALQREYFANLVRYCKKYGISMKDPDESYNVTKIKDAEGNIINVPDVVKFQNKNKSLVLNYVKGSKVVNKEGNIISDGTYNNEKDSTGFVVKNGVIQVIFDIQTATTSGVSGGVTSGSTEKTETDTDKTDTEVTIKTELEPDKDLKTYYNIIKQQLADIEDGISNANSLNIEIDNINKIIQIINKGGIGEIKELLKDPKTSENKKQEMEYDLDQYAANVNLLIEMKELISGVTKGKKIVFKRIKLEEEKEGDKEKKGESDEDKELSTESLVTEELRGIRTGFGVSRKMGDELTSFQTRFVGLRDMRFDDRRLSKLFESKEEKEKLTNFVIENKSPIIKIQLAAERIFGQADTPAKVKLKNSWDKMVEDAKGKYSRFMIVDQIDPRVLKKKFDDKELQVLDKENNKKGSIVDKSKNMKIEALLSQNKELGLTKTTFSNKDICGIMRLIDGDFIYTQDKINVEGSDHYVYRLLGSVDLEKLAEEKDTNKIKNHIKYNTLTKSLVPKDMVKNFGNGDFNFQTTYVVAMSTKHLIRIDGYETYKPNNVVLMYLYTAKGTSVYNIKNFKEEDLNKTYAFGLDTTNRVILDASTKDSTNPIVAFIRKLLVNGPLPIPKDFHEKYGITLDMTKLTFRSNTKFIDSLHNLKRILLNKKIKK